MKSATFYGRLLASAVVGAACILSLVPILLMILWALLPQREVFTLGIDIYRYVGALTFDNFVSATRNVSFGYRLIISLVMAGTISMGLAALGLPAAFGAARLGAQRAASVGFAFLGVRTLPSVAVSIPVFYLFNRSSVVPGWLSLGVLHLALTLPVYIWLAIPAFMTLPERLDEIAMTSGYGRLRFLLVTAAPSIFTRLFAVHLVCFILVWNETFFSSIFQVDTVTEAIPALISHHGYEWGTLMALGALVNIPALLLIAVLFHVIRAEP